MLAISAAAFPELRSSFPNPSNVNITIWYPILSTARTLLLFIATFHHFGTSFLLQVDRSYNSTSPVCRKGRVSPAITLGMKRPASYHLGLGVEIIGRYQQLWHGRSAVLFIAVNLTTTFYKNG